jgi:metal-dependent amidase/aminoacylase/carboxypeptidase family protein
MGTMRAFNEDWRASMHTKLKSITEHIGEIYGCEIDFEIRKGYPFVNNDEKLAADITKTAKELFGNDRYEEFVPKMWGEDFAYYSQAGSSVFWMIGVNSSDEVMPPLHNPRLAPDEEGMKTGMAMMLGVCFDL